MLEDDILLGIFNYYRLANGAWNVGLGWCKLSHVCRRWRHLIHTSAFHLNMHILCTNHSPIVDTLHHLPPLPLFIDYQHTLKRVQFHPIGLLNRVDPWDQDELGIYHALMLRDRVRNIELSVSPDILGKSLLLMDKSFPILENLVLSYTGYYESLPHLKISPLFLAPHLRNLDLGIRLPKRLRLLSSTPSLVTLKLTNIQASGYFRPRLLVARLESLPQLEELTIGFSIPIPRPSAERLLLGKQGTPVILSNLKSLTFRGVNVYLEHLISQIRAPVLRELDITLFNQLTFTLPHLSHFVNITEQISFPRTATIDFSDSSITLTHPVPKRHLVPFSNQCFTLCVTCTSSNWQMDCAAQICSALVSTLFGVESLSINGQSYHFFLTESDSETDEADDTIGSRTWHELLRLFVNVKELHIDHNFSAELSRALEVDEIGLDPGLLPDLQEIVGHYRGPMPADSMFGSFIHARQAAGRPVLFFLSSPPTPLYMPSPPSSPS